MFRKNGAEEGGTLETVGKFHMGKYPVTQGQWKAVMGSDKNPSCFDGEKAYDIADTWDEIKATPKFNRDNLPVETVSWYEVLVFANKLSEKEGLQPVYEIKGEMDPAKWGDVSTAANDDGWDAVKVVAEANGWRLPTEYEWEFAAKGGVKSVGYKGENTDKYYVYSGSDTAGEVAVYEENSGGRTHEVGKKKPNELGLYDMSGNVWEWCFDKYAETGMLSANRVFRGGSWYMDATLVGSAIRNILSPDSRYIDIGFRLVRS